MCVRDALYNPKPQKDTVSNPLDRVLPLRLTRLVLLHKLIIFSCRDVARLNNLLKNHAFYYWSNSALHNYLKIKVLNGCCLRDLSTFVYMNLIICMIYSELSKRLHFHFMNGGIEKGKWQHLPRPGLTPFEMWGHKDPLFCCLHASSLYRRHMAIGTMI